jgi:hypothetical protein
MPQWCVCNASETHNHKVEFVVAKVTPTVLAGENGRHKV